MKNRATVEEIQNQIAGVMAEADKLNEKADTAEGLTPEEADKLKELVSQFKQLQADLDAQQTRTEFVEAKERTLAPTRPAPKLETKLYAQPKTTDLNEGLKLFIRSCTPNADLSSDAQYKMRSLGFVPGAKSFCIPTNYRNLRFNDRTKLSTTGTGTGAELIWNAYSDKVVEYMLAESPILGLVSSEVINSKSLTKFKFDNTSMRSTYTSASGGSEINPTTPNVNMNTAKVEIKLFTITSGKQTVTMEELADSYVNLVPQMSKNNAVSHSRQFEHEIFSANGDGNSGVQGIESACTHVAGAAGTWSIEDLERLYFSVPSQYRKNCIWAAHGDTYGDLFSVLKNDVGDSLFGKLVQEDAEFDILLGKKFIQSDYITADRVLFFDPNGYQFVMHEGQAFEQFSDSSVYPDTVWQGYARFGGAWIGDPKSAKYMDLTGST